ncbi:uncharacterized protein [Amphiura filiformis]|uniref:uncharacterized protein isoform X2 n=1 Tax=Amphiura filiformis TaxID=82378 RepID=UPI003B20C263
MPTSVEWEKELTLYALLDVRQRQRVVVLGLLLLVICTHTTHGIKPSAPDPTVTSSPRNTRSQGTSPASDKQQDSDISGISAADEVNGNLGLGEPQRAERDIECEESPPGVVTPCILCNGEFSVKITDDRGYTCECLVCHPATYRKKQCNCTADGQVLNDTFCEVLLPGGGFMPETNVCPVPYPCSECPGDLVSVKECGGVEDTICDCPRDWYQTGLATCQPIPLCDVNHQRKLDLLPGADYTSYKCVKCDAGMYQPYNDSAELCRPRPKSTTTRSPPTKDPNSTASPDGACLPCIPCNCTDSIVTTEMSLSDLCNTAVEHAREYALVAAVCILAILIPVAYLLGRQFPNVICKSIKSFWRCFGFGSSGSYELTSPSEENHALDDVSQSADTSASSTNQ